MTDLLRAMLFGILEGVTEWLPVSSTGHLILLERYLALPLSPAVWEVFEVVIQMGAMGAVLVAFFHTLNPFSRGKDGSQRRAVTVLWSKVLLAVLPSAVLGLFLDDLLTAWLYTPLVVALMLFLYGVLFLVVERRKKAPVCGDVSSISYGTAWWIGCFQVLSLVPGTSRSGATVLGGILLGCSRAAAAEFSFFLGIPTIAGAGGLKIVKFIAAGERFTPNDLLLIATGTVTAFLVSLVTIRFLLHFVRRHSFAAFGIYRILLGCAVLADILL